MEATQKGGGMSQKEIREARRRKVLERGSDRLAYITGEIKSISSSQSSSLNDSLESAGPVNPGETGLKSLSTVGGPAEPKQDSSDPSSGPSTSFDAKDISQRLSNVQKQLQTLEADPVESTPLWDEATSASALSSFQRENTPAQTTPKSSDHSVNLPNFSFVALSQSIDSTVVVRALLSFLLAVLLVLQWTYARCEHPWGLESSRYIPRWPVSLIIITDVTVALWALLLRSVRVPSAAKKEKVVNRGGLAVFRESRLDQILAMSTQLEGALDLGLFLMKATRGLATDISIYVTTIVCAASVGESLRPSVCAYIIRRFETDFQCSEVNMAHSGEENHEFVGVKVVTNADLL